ncbi:MAG: endolytic transglycosylase MltG [Acidimicrobiales bacterium]
MTHYREPPTSLPRPPRHRRATERRLGSARYHHDGPRRWVAILAASFVVVGALVLGGGLWARAQIDPGGPTGQKVTVVIPKGASTTAIGDILAKAGVIHDGSLFPLYVKLKGSAVLYPGTYHLARNSPYYQALAALRAGPKLLVDKLVIPEGFTVGQIAQAVAALPGLHLSAAALLGAVASGAVRSPYEPAGVNNLEGLLFPATYEVSQDNTVIDVLEEMVGAFDDRAAQIGLTAAAKNLGYSPYQVVTVASIVEREAKFSSDFGPVASTLYNRLRLGMPLGADSTQTYYLRQSDPTLVPSAAQLDQPSPYNTRLNKGLPPTPISSPGLAALQAAVAPPSTNYLYFVEVNPDGKLGFASSTTGFVSLQAQCKAAGLC